MAEGSDQEKTEQPTSKRLSDSREKGQVPRSRELNTMIILMVGAVTLIMLGKRLFEQIMQLMIRSLSIDRDVIFDTQKVTSVFMESIVDGLFMLAPFFIIMTIAALTAPLLVSGWSFSLKAISVKLEKLDPIKGLGKLVSWRGLMELIKALAKFVLVGGVAIYWIWSHYESMMLLGKQSLPTGLANLAEHLGWTFLVFSVTLIILAAVDVPFQLWDHNRQLKMTKQEVKDEGKETEGSPEVKGRIRQRQREISRRRMMEEIPKADVIVTNPTHYSVAIKYNQVKMNAPVVIAKGADIIALQIRSIAKKHKIPIIQAPALTRALYYSTELNQEIPSGLYLAVAQLLAYVYQINNLGREKDGDLPDFPIPDDLKRDEK